MKDRYAKEGFTALKIENNPQNTAQTIIRAIHPNGSTVVKVFRWPRKRVIAYLSDQWCYSLDKCYYIRKYRD